MIVEQINSQWKELVAIGLYPTNVMLGPREYLEAEIQINHMQKMDPKKVYALFESGTCQMTSNFTDTRIHLYLIATPGIHFGFKRDDLPKIHPNEAKKGSV
jgi:hypothetical protein